MRKAALRSLPAPEDDCTFLSSNKKPRPDFKSLSSHARHHLSEDLVAEILLRLPARSIARLRCVSKTWLSIATDPSFIVAHADRAEKFLLVRSFSSMYRQFVLSYNRFFSFSESVLSFGQLNLNVKPDIARSSCNGLVLYWRMVKQVPSCEHYVMNPLTGLTVDIHHPNMVYKNGSVLELYYHRWTGEHRLLSIRNSPELKPRDVNHLEAEVLSLTGVCSSWRQIKSDFPYVYICYDQSHILVKDRLYWICGYLSEVSTMLVFDIFKEIFSLMKLPNHGRKALASLSDYTSSEFSLVDIEGNLCFLVVCREQSCLENVKICVWAAVDGDTKWKNTHTLCFNDDWLWAFHYPWNAQLFIICCLCIRETELMFLFDARHDKVDIAREDEHPSQYLFHWDLKSGKYWTEPLPAGLRVLRCSGVIYKETLVAAPFHHTTTVARIMQ